MRNTFFVEQLVGCSSLFLNMKLLYTMFQIYIEDIAKVDYKQCARDTMHR